MSHALRKLEVNAAGAWNRMPMHYYAFSDSERRRMNRGGIVEKWGMKFRLINAMISGHTHLHRYCNAQSLLNMTQKRPTGNPQ